MSALPHLQPAAPAPVALTVETVEHPGGPREPLHSHPRLESTITVIERVCGPHAASHERGYGHGGIEMALVLSGRLVVEVDGEPHALRPGDSICFPSTLTHRWLNPGDGEARAVLVQLDERRAPGG